MNYIDQRYYSRHSAKFSTKLACEKKIRNAPMKIFENCLNKNMTL